MLHVSSENQSRSVKQLAEVFPVFRIYIGDIIYLGAPAQQFFHDTEMA